MARLGTCRSCLCPPSVSPSVLDPDPVGDLCDYRKVADTLQRPRNASPGRFMGYPDDLRLTIVRRLLNDRFDGDIKLTQNVGYCGEHLGLVFHGHSQVV